MEKTVHDIENKATEPTFDLDTNEFAVLVKSTPGNVRFRLCKFGSYWGVKPMRMPGGRLLWPRVTAADLAKAA